MASGKKCSYKQAFLQWGFTGIVYELIAKPLCVLCNEVCSVESMKPSKLKDHFERSRAEFSGKDIEYLKGRSSF
jgi:hypothetical protein